MRKSMTKAGRGAALCAGVVFVLTALAPQLAAAKGSGYELKCKTIWEKVPNGGYMPDRPGYRIKGRKCVAVPKRPSYLDKPRQPLPGRINRR